MAAEASLGRDRYAFVRESAPADGRIDAAMLAPEHSERYARHLRLPEVGARGQERLLSAAARIVGSGRAAEEAALYLCAAGVGRLVLDPTLRETLGERLAELNPDVRLVAGAVGALEVAPQTPERRADGARAALDALVALSGAGSGRTA